jgi:hypothetical protein
MSSALLRRGLLVAALVLWVGGVAAAPNFPERYIDPDDLTIDEDEGDEAAWPGGIGAFDGRPYDVYDAEGVVEFMDPVGPAIVIDGLEYGFGLQPDIRLLVGAGAPTLLVPGMVLEFYFSETPDSDTAGNIVAAIELDPAAMEPE